jgi:MarR family transcriptional regulator, lower aerobic nicotinate degradation pathway regulator
MRTNAAAAAVNPPSKAVGSYVIDDQVGFLLRLANQRHASIFLARINCGLTPTQWSVAAKLCEIDAVSQNHLGRLTGMDAATVKGVVDRLSEKGLVTRRNDRNHARRHVLALTKKGRTLVERHCPDAKAISTETLAPLSITEQTTFLNLLAKLT